MPDSKQRLISGIMHNRSARYYTGQKSVIFYIFSNIHLHTVIKSTINLPKNKQTAHANIKQVAEIPVICFQLYFLAIDPFVRFPTFFFELLNHHRKSRPDYIFFINFKSKNTEQCAYRKTHQDQNRYPPPIYFDYFIHKKLGAVSHPH